MRTTMQRSQRVTHLLQCLGKVVEAGYLVQLGSFLVVVATGRCDLAHHHVVVRRFLQTVLQQP